jgi:hypothetical protein
MSCKKKVTSDTNEGSGMNCPSFSGKAEDDQMFDMRFMAYAGCNKFRKALMKDFMLELPTNEEAVLDLATAEGKAHQKAVDMNLTAVGAYTWAITTNVVAVMVFQSMTADCYGRLACKIKEALDNNLKPKDTMSYVDLRRDLNAIAMKKNDDPAGLFEQNSAIKNR